MILLVGEKDFPDSSVDKESSCNAGDTGNVVSIPVSRRSSGEGNGNPLQYSYLESPMERRSLVGYCPWGHTELDRAERLSMHTRSEEEEVRLSPKFGDCTPK